jgi:Tfp pilus assembly protein PilF
LLAGRAHALCRQGDTSQALAICDGALRQPGSSSYRWLVRGEIMVAMRQDVDRHCFDKAQQLDPDWLVPLEAALAYLHNGQPALAVNRARAAVEKAPDQYYAWYVQGLSQLRSKLERAARESFQRCLDLCPRHVDAQQRLAEMEVGRWSPGRIWRRLFTPS